LKAKGKSSALLLPLFARPSQHRHTVEYEYTFPASFFRHKIRGQRLPGQRQTDLMNLANIKELEATSAVFIVWWFYGT